MSSLPNSEKMRSSQLNDTRQFEKYGVKYTYGVVIETHQAWAQMLRLKDGTLTPRDLFDPDAHKGNLPDDGKLTTEWAAVDSLATFERTAFCTVQDDLLCQESRNLEMFITADGQIMGIMFGSDDDVVTLLDPCIVLPNPRTGAVSFNPIFGVQRFLRLSKSAIRATMPPPELLISAYPGFLIQHRMYRYQMKPSVPFSTTEVADNDATPVETQSS